MVDWGYVIGIIGTVVSIAAAILTARREIAKAAKEDGTILTEIGYIKANTDDIKRHQEKTDDKFMKLAERMSATEISVERAHKRIDRLEGLHDGQH